MDEDMNEDMNEGIDGVELFDATREIPSFTQMMAKAAQTRREEEQQALRYNIVGLLISKAVGEVDSRQIIEHAEPLVDFIVGK